MKKAWFFAAFAALFTLSCSLENPGLRDDTLRAEILAPMTRTTLEAADGGYRINWTAGDRIAVTDGMATAVYEASTGGSTSADFRKVSGDALTGDTCLGYYPAEIAGGVLPQFQEWKGGDAVAVPMVSDPMTDPSLIKFRPVTGVIRLNVSTAASGVKVREIRLQADQGLSGDYRLIDGAAVVSGTQPVILRCGEGVSVGTEPVSFHVAVPEGTYTGLTITVITTGGLASVTALPSDACYSVRLAQLRSIDLEAAGFTPFTGSGEATLMYGPDFNELIKQLATPGRMAIDNDSTITHIVFRTGDPTPGQVLVSDVHSENPVWASWDESTGTVTVSSPAGVLYANTHASHMFRGFCLVREIENLQALNTSRAENLSYFFHRCFSLERVDLSHFETAACESFGFMFSYCQSLESLDVSHFNTARATTLANMFQHCEKVPALEVGHFVTDSVRSMDNTFSDCHALVSLDLSAWNTDNVEDTRSMFNRCKSIKDLDIRHMSFPKTGRMTYMFYQMEALETLHIEGMDCSRWTVADNQVHMFRYLPRLKEVFFGEKGYNTTSFKPGNFWTPSNDARGVRTASLSGALTIHCCEAAAAWLSATNLRWVNSGYKGQTAVPVTFVDYLTGEVIPVSWPAN